MGLDKSKTNIFNTSLKERLLEIEATLSCAKARISTGMDGAADLIDEAQDDLLELCEEIERTETN